MGGLQSVGTDQMDDPGTTELKIPLDFKRSVGIQFQPLLDWSLRQIREIYTPFKQRKGSPLLNRSEFSRFLRLSRIMSFHLYDEMYKQNSLNVFQVISILVLTSFTSYSYKIQFLFNVFDLDRSKGLQFKELILSFKSLVRGYSILTHQPIPNNDLLERYAQTMFSRADLNNDQCLQIGQQVFYLLSLRVLNWFEGNSEGIFLFKRFEPELFGKEDYYIFNGFSPSLNHEEIKITFKRIEKEYQKIPLNEDDFKPLNVSCGQINSLTSKMPKSLTTRSFTQKKFELNIGRNSYNRKFLNQNSRDSKKVGFQIKRINTAEPQIIKTGKNMKPTLLKKKIIKKQEFSDISSNKENQQNGIQNSLKICHKNSSENTSNLEKLNEMNSLKIHSTRNPINLNSNARISNPSNQKSLMSSMKQTRNSKKVQTSQLSYEPQMVNLRRGKASQLDIKKKKFNNIIILKGKTITKTGIFDLREYFQRMANGKQAISVENFIEAFNEEKYNHMKSVAASLFNFLDRNQDGKVTFKELIQKLYPDLTDQHHKIIKGWNCEFNQNFNLEKKIQDNREHEQLKKSVLPKTCLMRYQEIFQFFDKERKGYVDIEDLKRILSEVSTQGQLLNALEDNDKDKDGKLNMKEFIHIILPIDLQIQGL